MIKNNFNIESLNLINNLVAMTEVISSAVIVNETENNLQDDYVKSKKLAKQLQHVDVMEDYLKKVIYLNVFWGCNG